MAPTTHFLESILHSTNGRSFSIHYTSVPTDSTSLLYLHWHNEVELLYIEDGDGIFYIEEQEYHLYQGDALFVSPGLLHHGTYSQQGKCSFYAIVFSPNYLFDTNLNPQYCPYVQPLQDFPLLCCVHLSPTISWQETMIHHIKNIISKSKQPFPQWELFIQGSLLLFWQELYNNHLIHQTPAPHLKRFSQQITPSLNYIHQHYPEELSLKNLADLSHFSEGQFCRLFKELTGYTPFHYINRYRIMQSCHLLTSTSQKIAEIAMFCGYNNISYFNREFKKRMGTSPNHYRKLKN